MAYDYLSDEELDTYVRQILRTTPSSGRRFVEGGLRYKGLCIQRRRKEVTEESIQG